MRQSGEKREQQFPREKAWTEKGRKLTDGDKEPERDVEEGEERDKDGVCAKRCEQVDQDEHAPPCGSCERC